MLVYKMDNNGNVIESKSLNPVNTFGYIYDGNVAKDGSLLFAGIYKKSIESNVCPAIIMTDLNLEAKSFKIVETVNPTKVNSVVELDNKSVILAGYSVQVGNENAWIGRTLESDQIALTEEDIDSKEFVMFPNPCKDYCYFKLGDEDKALQIQFFDLTGKEVRTINFNKETFIYKSDFQKSGLYMYFINDLSGRRIKHGSILFVD